MKRSKKNSTPSAIWPKRSKSETRVMSGTPLAGVGSNVIQPFAPHHASTQAWTFSPRTRTYWPNGPISPPTNPDTKRVGTPSSRSRSAWAVAKAWQCPRFRSVTKASTGCGAGGTGSSE